MKQGLLAVAIAWCGLALVSAQSADEISVVHVQKNVYMLASRTGNVAVQIGDDGVLLVDTGTAPMAQKLFAAIRTLSNKPIHTIIKHGPARGPHRRQSGTRQARCRWTAAAARHGPREHLQPDGGCGG
jgi:hypothetical protein